MGFFEELKERGLVAQVTFEDELLEHLSTGRRTAYIGFDPTAPSLHVGHLLQVMTLSRWQKHGHRAIAVAGGGTAMIGDPTGKSELRQMLTAETIKENIDKIKNQLRHFIDFSSPDKAIIVNNNDWLGKLHYLEFLRDIGPHFTVNRMLAAECFKQRWEKGLTFLEFNYMLLQSYDFLHLYKAHDCTLQMGGDDQWSNILAGTDLIRRLLRGKAFCMTTPLLTNSDGKKMGKTEKGAVWLDPNLTSPYEYFQYWRNVEDAVVETCLKFFTFLPMNEVAKLSALKGKEINEAKKILAYECTKLLHGEEAAKTAQGSADNLFVSGADTSGNEPTIELSKQDVTSNMLLIDLLVLAKIFDSKGEARRMLQQGGVTVGEEKISDVNQKIKSDWISEKSGFLIRKGKKHFFRIILK